jgi:hypothetical protein
VKNMKILFHSNQLALRGTEVALYDYAHYNENFLGNESLIVSNVAGKGTYNTLRYMYWKSLQINFVDRRRPNLKK